MIAITCYILLISEALSFQVGSLLRDRTLETSHPLENQPFPLSLWSFSKSSPSQDPMSLWSEFSYSSSIALGPAGNCGFNRWQKCRFWVIFSFAGRNRWFTRFPLWQIWSFPHGFWLTCLMSYPELCPQLKFSFLWQFPFHEHVLLLA